MERTLIQEYTTAIVEGFYKKSLSLGKLGHKLTKGELREFFVSNLLKPFLTSQIDIGSGIIINQVGDQSNQTDIVIFDKRISPPFISEQNLGVYPAESVIATIEVKSRLRKEDLHSAEKAAENLHDNIYNPQSSIYGDKLDYIKPICLAFGYYGNGATILSDADKGKSWLRKNTPSLNGICLMKKFSWMVVQKDWVYQGHVKSSFEETKRFLAILLDRVRNYSVYRLQIISQSCPDIMGIYLRDQPNIKKYFEQIKSK